MPKKQPEVAGPIYYRATVYHEIPFGDGVKRVEIGAIVAADGDDVTIYPPEVFAAEFPDVTDIPDQSED